MDEYEIREAAREKMDALETEAMQDGMHLKNWELGGTWGKDDDDLSVNLFIMSSFRIGDLAFSDRVQHPERVAKQEVVDEVEDEYYRDKLIDLATGGMDELFGKLK